MDRRGFLTATAAMTGGVLVTADAATAAHTRRPVVLWEDEGGFVPAGYLSLRAPHLAVYGDGLVVADAARWTRLRGDHLDDLVDDAVDVLSNRANGVRRPGSPAVADVPTTRFTARRGGRTWSIAAEALAVLREHRAYPRPLYDLLDRVTALRDRTTRAGRVFDPTAVRLVTVRVEQPPGTPVAPWPTGVPALAPTGDRVSRTVDLYGTAARAVVRGVPRAQPWTFTTFRLREGRFLAAGWRRLLPHEQN